MIVATVPTVTLVLFGVGAFERAAEGVGRLVAWAKGVLRIGEPARGGWWRELVAGAQRDRLETDLLLFLAFAVAVGAVSCCRRRRSSAAPSTG